MITKHSTDKAKILEGMRKVAEIVCSTAGPISHEVALGFDKFVKIIKDGVNIAKFMAWPDPLEDLGRKIIVGAGKAAVEDSGDGTTACIGMTYALCNTTYEPTNVHEFARGMEAAKDDAIKVIKESARPIIEEDGTVNRELMRYVANISSNGHEVSEKIADLVADIGQDGIISVQESLSAETTTKRETGFKLEWGVANPNMYNVHGGVVLENPVVIVADEELTNYVNHLQKPIEEWGVKHFNRNTGTGRPLVIFARDVQEEALGVLLKNAKSFPIVVCKIPGQSLWIEEQLGDILKATKSGRVWGKAKGKHLKEFDGVFGSIKKFEATMQKCFMVLDDDVDLSGLNADLKKELETTEEKHRADWLKERISRNSGGFGVISVGGKTDLDRKSLVEIIDDTQKACMASYALGVVPGGGRMLQWAEMELNDTIALDKHSKDYLEGYAHVLYSMQVPFMNIVGNAGVEPFYELPEGVSGLWAGLDVTKPEWVDTFKAGIIDPAKVVISSLENAVSVARRFHTVKHILWQETPDA